MINYSRYLRVTTAVAVALITLSNVNQAQAQCFTTGTMTPNTGTAGSDDITCSGTQVGDIDLLGDNDTLTNNSDSTITGDILPGIGTDTIINSGIINGHIHINGDAGGGDIITNNVGALIEDLGTGASVDTAVRVSGSDVNSIYNAGTIQANLKAIRIEGFSDVIGGFLNDTTAVIIGDLDGNFVGADPDSSAFEITPGSDISGGFENRGSITHSTGTAVNIGISSTADVTGAIVNSGTITGGSNGIDFDGSSGDMTGGITNTGTITGISGSGIALPFAAFGVDVVGGLTNQVGATITGNTGIFVTSSNAISGGINNSGTIEGTGGTAISLANLGAVTPITINGGRIIGDVTDSNIASGRSPVTVTGSGFKTEGDFTVSDLIVNAGQDFTISADNTVTLNDMTASTGTIIFELAPASAAQLNVTGAGNDIDVSASTVEVLSNGRSLMDGESILIGTGVTAVNGGAGQALTDVTDNSLFFDFQLADGAAGGVGTNNELYLLVVQASNPCAGQFANNPDGACGALSQLTGTANPELLQIISGTGGTNAEEILEATLPEVNGGSISAAQNVTGNTIRLVSDRLTTIRATGSVGSGISSGDITENLQGWGQVYGQKINQGERKGIAGFEAVTRGFTIGADTEDLYDKTTLGVALSYANTDVFSENANNTRSEIESYNVTLYGDYDLEGNAYLIGDLGYTYGDNETTRFNVGGVSGLNANSDYGSHQIQARAIVVKDYYPDNLKGLKVSPRAQARYTYYQNEDINETGAGGANLNVDSDALHMLELGAEVNVRKDITQSDGGILSPEVSAGYRYDLIGDAVQTTSTFEGGGPSFRSDGADPAQSTFTLGLGVGYTSPSNVELTASYDYEYKDQFNGHSGFIRIAAPF